MTSPFESFNLLTLADAAEPSALLQSYVCKTVSSRSPRIPCKPQDVADFG